MKLSVSQVIQPARLWWHILALTLISMVLCAGDGWPETSPASSKTGQQWWEQFRETHPFHSQIIAVSDPDQEGERILIIAEPPPNVSQEDVHRILAPYATSVEIKKAIIMFDGYVRDVVATLRPANADALDELMTHLHLKMFGSTYGAFLAKLPVNAPIILDRSLNLAISTADLQRWLLEESNLLVPTTLTKPLPFSELMQNKKRGIFRTAKAGLLLWVLDRNGDITQRDDEIRHFVLDGDMIIGAVADKDTVCIVARERTSSILRLPPLRTEMVKLLAAIQTPELAQSYERNMWLAGRSEDGFDWAPIFLSPELINTELGSLLNITDQLLKSWSERGQIKYHSFDYPAPPSFPFGATRASTNRQKDDSGFLFNWNTAGVLHATSINGIEFAAVHRTGSLPIIYGSVMSRRVEQERDGYKWFSTIGDANLARVVQYSALFSIFKRYGIKSKVLTNWTPPHLAADAIRKASLLVLHHITNSEQTPRYLEKAINLSESLQNGRIDASTSFKQQVEVMRDLLTIFVEAPHEKRLSLIKVYSSFLSDLSAIQEEFYKEIIREGEGARELSEEMREKLEQFNAIATFARMAGTAFQRVGLSSLLADDIGVRQAITAASEQEEQRWVKTASIVLSQDIENKRAIGGHNISAKMTEFRADASVPTGQVRAYLTPDGVTTVAYNRHFQYLS